MYAVLFASPVRFTLARDVLSNVLHYTVNRPLIGNIVTLNV
jgi:hypothetical protein